MSPYDLDLRNLDISGPTNPQTKKELVQIRSRKIEHFGWDLNAYLALSLDRLKADEWYVLIVRTGILLRELGSHNPSVKIYQGLQSDG